MKRDKIEKMEANMKNLIKKLILTLSMILIIYTIFSVNIQAATPKFKFKKNSKNVTLYVTQKKTLKVIVPKKFKNKKIKYSSSNQEIFKVTKKGVIKALNKGNATVYAKIKGTKKKIKTPVTVLQNIEQINIINTSAKYYVNKKYNLLYEMMPQTSDETVKWKSSDKTIAKINKTTGLLKIKKAGVVTITAYSTKTKKETSITIHTEDFPQIRIKEGTNINMEYGDSIQLHVEFINHPKVNMTFSTPDGLVKVTPSGYVTTTRPGTVQIKATSADNKYKVTTTLHIGAGKGFVSKAMLSNLDIDDCTNLMIVAHPDDETIWGGAHLMEGKWFVVCMTNQFFTLRKKEYRNVLNSLGVKGIILDYPDLYKGLDGKWKIDQWKYNIQDALANDVNTIINYKNWDQIVTHNPAGEYGHIHHKYVNTAVKNTCSTNSKTFQKLWYFGTYYKKGMLPTGLPQISQETLSRKTELLKLYARELPSIKTNWEQMVPHENWTKAVEYK